MINCLCNNCENVDSSVCGLVCMVLGNVYDENKLSCKDFEPKDFEPINIDINIIIRES
jgi:hypothetical protein